MATQNINKQPLCIQYPPLTVPFELKSGLLHLLPTFRGLAGEDPHKHLKEFHMVCSTMKPRKVTEEQIKLCAFPFSLADKAKDWFYYLPSGSITTWDQMKQQFLEKFFPASRAANIRKDICLLTMDQNMIDDASGGALVHKMPTKARTLISNMAANSQQFGTRQECPIKSVGEVKTSFDQRLDNLTALVEKLVMGTVYHDLYLGGKALAERENVEEFNDFLALYPVPSEYHVILPKSNQTVFNAPPGYVGLYTHSFSLVNLRLPLTKFFCWHEWFFYVQDFIIPAKYPQLLSEQNKLDLKSFKDKLPPNIEENPMFQRLSRYPISVCVFPDPILFLVGLKPSWEHGQRRPAIMAGGKGIYLSFFFLYSPFSLIYDLLSLSTKMAFRNFIYTEDDEDLMFLPKEPSLGFGISSLSVSVNTEPLKANEEPNIQPVKVTVDSGRSPRLELFVLASGSSTSRATRANTSSSKEDAPFLTVSDDDEGIFLVSLMVLSLKMPMLVISRSIQAVVDNAINRRSRELLQVIEKLKGKCDIMRSRERARDEECEGLRVKCEAAMTDFEKNPTVVALLEKIYALSIEAKEHKLSLNRMMLETEKARLEAVEVSLWKEVEELKQDRREVVSKVVPYVAMELVHSDDMGSLVGKLVSFAIVFGRCRAFEQVAGMKEPFDLSKVKGYRSSYKKDHT
ncbi:UBN2 domain-containing protein [Tanacetum coccineum]